MISKLLRRRSAAPKGPVAAIPAGQRIYAIGDIHGRRDLLDALLARIAHDDAERGGEPAMIIFLGDLVDRGPESAQVVERLLTFEASRPAGSTRFLLGNHEEVFLSVLRGDERSLRFFLKIGGRETILSYGISEEEYAALDYPGLLEAFCERVPQAHVDFASRFEDLIIVGDYAFVHAGISPRASLAQQRAKDLRWIRDEFLDFNGSLEKVVVHGHTISENVELLPHRIGLDTGAYASGKLTAMGFEGDERWTLQTAA